MQPKPIPSRDRLIFAMDVADAAEARQTVEQLGDSVTFYKIGLELFMAGGYFELLDWMVARDKKLPVVLFVAGGVATPADAAMMMQLGADGVFVGSGIFKSGNPVERAKAIVKATTAFTDATVIADVSRGLGEAMVGINVSDLPAPHRLAERGW